jgi:hypothetical protein
MQPEMGEMDLRQDIEEFDAVYTTAVKEAEKSEQNIIHDQESRKQYRQRKRKKKSDDDENEKEEDELFVDIRV